MVDVVPLRTLPISIHAPREGSDLCLSALWTPCGPFLSTLPARGATGTVTAVGSTWSISIHAPREGSDQGAVHRGLIQRISIHAPREGSDQRDITVRGFAAAFLSTLPARGATGPDTPVGPVFAISIHAPREGSDPSEPSSAASVPISIHAPREGSDSSHVQ